jgi:hypothetical protein
MKDFLLGTFTPEDLVKYKERVAVADKLFDKFKIARSGIQVATTVDKIHEIEKEFLGHVTYFTNAPYGLDGETLRSFK